MKFDKKEAAGQPLPFSAPKNPQWVMLAALLLSYAAGYEYVDRCLGFGVASEYSAWRAGVLVFVALYTVVVELAAWAGDRKPSRIAAAWWCCWLVQSLAMAVLCGVYTLFFAVQAAEFAAALGAPLPLTAPDAAAFAVNGFWEFCRILALDLTVLAALHFLGAQPVTQKGLSRVLAVVLCGFGAGFAMLAAAKLAVYINLYGPTVRRIWAAWVLGALLLASVLAAVRLFCGIPAARMAFVAAAFSFSLLCCLPLERFCVDAQLARPDCDWQLLQRYTWQSSELDEYITQQAGENANLSE